MRSAHKSQPPASHAPGAFTGHAIRVGINYDADKWRCKTCKFMNESTATHCNTCREERKIEQKTRFPAARGVYGGGTRPTGTKPRGPVNTRPQRAPAVPRGAPVVRKTQSRPAGSSRPQAGIISTALAKPPAPKPTYTGQNIMTFKKYDQENKSVPGEAKKPRLHKEPNLEMLKVRRREQCKRIAMNSEDGDTMPCMRKLKQKQFVQNTRDPAKFNMHTFVRQYGDVPK